MDDVSAELVRNIVNERQAKGKEFVDCRVMEIGRPPLRVTVPARKRKGSPLPDNDTVMTLVRTGLSGPNQYWVVPCPRVMTCPQTPDSMPMLELAGETESDNDMESVSDSEWRDRLANDMEFRAVLEGLPPEEDNSYAPWASNYCPTSPDFQ